MAKYSSQELDSVYHALANSTRRKILTRLVKQSAAISELAEPFDMSLAAVSKHIKVLEKAGLITKRQQGTTHICDASLEPIRSAAALVHFFEQFLDATPAAPSASASEDSAEEEYSSEFGGGEGSPSTDSTTANAA